MLNYFYNNRISAYMLALALFLLGIISVKKIPVSMLPQVSYPGISVEIEYPGVSPEKIESIITKPVEKIIKTVPGIKKIFSVSEEGKSRVNISFQLDDDIKISALKVREKISLIRDSFPREVQEPVVMRYDPSDRPVLIANVISDGNILYAVRDKVEKELKPKLQRIDGISEIFIVGGAQREIHIDLDRDKYYSKGFNSSEIFNAVQSNNYSISGGLINTSSGNRNLVAPGRFVSIKDISSQPLGKTENSSLIRISDMGEVNDSFREEENKARINGKEEVVIYVHKAGDANTISVCSEAKKIFSEYSAGDIRIVFDQSEKISSSVENVVSSALFGLLIIIVALYFFVKSMRVVISIALTIPLSVVITILFMYFFKIEFNLISLCGLSLASGLVATNGIIIAESILSDKNITPDSVRLAVKKVSKSLVASTLTSVVAFLPVLFGDVYMKKMYADLAFTISASLFISLFLSVILIPVIILDVKTNSDISDFLTRQRESFYIFLHRKLKVSRFSVVGDNIVQFSMKIEVYFKRLFSYAFTNQKRFIIIIILSFLVSSTLAFFGLNAENVDPTSSREFFVTVELPTGTALEYSDIAAKDVEADLKKRKEIKEITSKIEKWSTSINVKLIDDISREKDVRRIKKEIGDSLNVILKKYDGFAFVSETSEESDREVNISFQGNDIEILKAIARNAAGIVGKISGVEECVLRFREGRPEYDFVIDRKRASDAGLSVSDISDFMRNSIFGPVVTKYIDNDREVDVRMRFREEDRKTIDQIKNYYVKDKDGKLVFLSDISDIREKKSNTRIWRLNGRRSVMITAKLGDIGLSRAAGLIEDKMKEMKFPEEYGYELDDNIKKIEESKFKMASAVLLSVILIYMIMASAFESLRLPLVIMLTIPLASIGIFFSLLAFSYSFSISVFIGVILVAGVSVNNGIILADAVNVNRMHAGKKSLLRVIEDTVNRYFKPIFVMNIISVLGMVPMLIKTGDGSSLWKPLSLTVVSGIIVSMIITMVLIPLILYILYQRKVLR